ncbi:MAG: SAM-dependent methyltransferase [Chitinophagales bacterium]|nr:MAG: SAM-dependent methyltransferase [Chitinophagales bacterium]
MTLNYRFIIPSQWRDYALIDSGNFEKLERFGRYILQRPEPQALWNKRLSEQEWEQKHHARYVREKGTDTLSTTAEKGRWIKKAGMPDHWPLSYHSRQLKLHFNLSLTAFGHIGIFPEQAENWEFIYNCITSLRSANRPTPKVLNLFAYTGGATLAACAAGAEVVHVDAVNQVVKWASENKQASSLPGVTRWIVEDVMKFVKREVKRGSRYDGIVLDPPAYGRGPKGEKWLLDKQLNELLCLCSRLLHPKRSFMLVNIYSVGLSALVLDNILDEYLKNCKRELGELVLMSQTGQKLPLGVFLRFFNA